MTLLQSLLNYGLQLLILVGVPILILRAIWYRRRAASGFSTTTPYPNSSTNEYNHSTSIIETITIAGLGLIILALTATTVHTNGLMLRLDEQPKSVVIYSVAMFAIAVAGFVCFLYLASRGRSRVALFTLSGFLMFYAFALNGTDLIYNLKNPDQAESLFGRPHSPLDRKLKIVDPLITFDIARYNLTGADIWVNGVALGKTPVKIRLSEYLEKVPDWSSEPTENSDLDAVVSKSIRHNGKSYTRLYAKVEFLHSGRHLKDYQIRDDLLTKLSKRERHPLENEKKKNQISSVNRGPKFQPHQAYVRVELNGQPGLASSFESAGFFPNPSFSLKVVFSQREITLKKLLDRARLTDYEIDAEWIKKMEDLGIDGWLAVRKAMPHEPGMSKLYDTWAATKYQLDSIQPFDGAMRKLREIMQEADKYGLYFTASPAGRAVELLAPKLRYHDIVGMAEQLLDSTGSISYGQSNNFYGNQAFWIRNNAFRLRLPSEVDNNGLGFVGGAGGRCPPSGLAVAHAFWLVRNNFLQTNPTDAMTERLQNRIAIKMIQMNYLHQVLLKESTFLGGAPLEKFLLRQVAHTPLRTDNFEDSLRTSYYHDFNRWWYWAAHLMGDVGTKFRKQHYESLKAFPNQIKETLHFGSDLERELSFVFIDKYWDNRSFGYRYWPEFRGAIRATGIHRALSLQVNYLLAMEPAPPIALYAQIFADEKRDDIHQHHHNITEAFRLLNRLPIEKRAAVLDAIYDAVITNADIIITPVTNKDKKVVRVRKEESYLLREWKEYRYRNIDDLKSADYYLNLFRDESADQYQMKHIKKQFIERLLQNAGKKSVLVEALATAPEEEYRLLAVEAIERHPSPEYRKLLDGLKSDDRPKIQDAIDRTLASWQVLEQSSE